MSGYAGRYPMFPQGRRALKCPNRKCPEGLVQVGLPLRHPKKCQECDTPLVAVTVYNAPRKRGRITTEAT